MAGMCKVPAGDLPVIKQRLQNGETFTSVAKQYNVTPYAIQKRLRCYHPTGGRNIADIWNYLPDYIHVVDRLSVRYRYVDVNIRDIILDFAYSLTKNELNRIRDSVKPFWTAYDIIRGKLYMCVILKRKRHVLSWRSVLCPQRLSP